MATSVHETKLPPETVMVVKSILDKCKIEKDKRKLNVNIENDIDRVSDYTGLPHLYIRTLYSVGSNSSKLDLDHRIFILKCMLQSYSEKRTVSFSDLHIALNCNGKIMDLDQLVLEMMSLGYENRKTKNDESLLMENPKITFDRFHYLKKIIKAKETGRNVYYIDERMIVPNDVSFKKPPVDWEMRNSNNFESLTLCHLISKNGYSCGLFYMQLTKEDLLKWFFQVVLPDLKPSSIIVFDNNFYTSMSDKTTVSRYHSKEDMLRWLKQQNIPCDINMHKAELYELIDKCSDNTKLNKLERILKAHGHEVLHLPLTLQDLSPTELLWKDIRLNFKNQNLNVVLAMKEDVSGYIRAVTTEKWNKYDSLIKNFEIEIFELDKKIEKALDENFTSLLDLQT